MKHFEKHKAGQIVICNTTIFNLTKGMRYEVALVNCFDGVFLKDFENLSGGYGMCWFDSESRIFADDLLKGIMNDIKAFEELENDIV